MCDHGKGYLHKNRGWLGKKYFEKKKFIQRRKSYGINRDWMMYAKNFPDIGLFRWHSHPGKGRHLRYDNHILLWFNDWLWWRQLPALAESRLPLEKFGIYTHYPYASRPYRRIAPLPFLPKDFEHWITPFNNWSTKFESISYRLFSAYRNQSQSGFRYYKYSRKYGNETEQWYWSNFPRNGA